MTQRSRYGYTHNGHGNTRLAPFEPIYTRPSLFARLLRRLGWAL